MSNLMEMESGKVFDSHKETLGTMLREGARLISVAQKKNTEERRKSSFLANLFSREKHSKEDWTVRWSMRSANWFLLSNSCLIVWTPFSCFSNWLITFSRSWLRVWRFETCFLSFLCFERRLLQCYGWKQCSTFTRSTSPRVLSRDFCRNNSELEWCAVYKYAWKWCISIFIQPNNRHTRINVYVVCFLTKYRMQFPTYM